MIVLALLTAATTAACPVQDGSAEFRPSSVAVSTSAARPVDSDSLRDAFLAGKSWEDFLAGVTRRKALWTENWEKSAVSDGLLARASRSGPWRVLVIAEDGCSDSANTVPFIARLLSRMAESELRVIDSKAGAPWMQVYRTPDGRAATPTILLLDEEYRVRGCWIEQPAELQAFWLPLLAAGKASENVTRKMEWYAQDQGAETVREFVDILEAAGSGNAICNGPVESAAA